MVLKTCNVGSCTTDYAKVLSISHYSFLSTLGPWAEWALKFLMGRTISNSFPRDKSPCDPACYVFKTQATALGESRIDFLNRVSSPSLWLSIHRAEALPTSVEQQNILKAVLSRHCMFGALSLHSTCKKRQ